MKNFRQITMFSAFLLILALASKPVSAQSYTVNAPCLPGVEANGWSGGWVEGGVTANGVYVTWLCREIATGNLRRVSYVGTVAELSKIGSRMQTIIRASNPLLSLQTAGNRFPMLPLTDPSLAAIVDDMKNGR